MKRILSFVMALLLVFTLAGCATDTSGLESSISDLGAQLSSVESSVSALEKEVSDLQSNVADLEAKLTAVPDTEIILMHTNDVHGQVNYDKYAGIGYAAVSAIIENVRDNYDYSFLIDAGDNFHGTTFATLEEGASMVTVLNAVGYDMLTPGNHDFDYGQDRLLELQKMAEFPFITANIQNEDGSNMFDPYIIQNFGDVKVGFFGLTTPETTYKTHPDNVVGLTFTNPITQAEAMVAELKDKVDVVVLVAHIGLDENTEITTEDIANAVDGIDIIIDGHSHTYLNNGLMVGDTLIASAGSLNAHLGGISVVVDASGNVSTSVVQFEDAGSRVYVQNIIDQIALGHDSILNEVVGSTAELLNGTRDYVRTGETNLGRLISDSMLEVTGADVAITNGGGIRSDIPVGEVTVDSIITVLPFGNIIITLDLTGQEIIDALEHGTSAAPSAEGMFPHVAGITYTLDLDAEAGSRVQDVLVAGTAIDLTATYTVATNDFMAAGGDGYDVFAGKEHVGEFMGLHEALELQFTKAMGDVVIPTDVRLTIIGG